MDRDKLKVLLCRNVRKIGYDKREADSIAEALIGDILPLLQLERPRREPDVQFTVRMSPGLHEQLINIARQRGETLNGFIRDELRKAVK